MISNYLKIAWRSLRKNRASSFINIGGLAVGMTVAILIGLWVYDEITFNRYHTNHDRIVKVMDNQGWEGQKMTNDVLPMPLGAALWNDYAGEIESVTVVREIEDHVIAAGDNKFTQPGHFMEPDGPAMLSLKMVRGSRNGLNDPNSILLNETLAKKLFGNDDPIDQRVTIDADKTVRVAGVFGDIPNNSDFRMCTFIAPLRLFGASPDDWANFNMSTYLLLKEGVRIDQFSARIKNVLSAHSSDQRASHALFVQSMNKWHLYSAFENHVAITSQQLKFVWFYAAIGAFVLLLACINFMNLSTARSEKRAREVGVRKAVGSLRRQLIQQFYTESLLIATIAFLFSLLLTQLMLPWFNDVADKQVAIPWDNPFFWLLALGFTFFTGLLAGRYPALYLSSFNPVAVLKGNFRAGRGVTAPRKVLVVLQFTVSVALIIGTGIVYTQLDYARKRPVGYDQAGLLTIQMKAPDWENNYEALKHDWLQTGVLASVGRANYGITDTRGWNGGFSWEGKPPVADQSFNTIFVSQEYGKTTGWQLLAGRDFQEGLTSDSNSIILNELAVKTAGITNPVGQKVRWEPGWREPVDLTIVGVVRDMVKGSPYKPAYPSVIFLGGGNWLFMKIRAGSSYSEALPKLEAAFKRSMPAVPFDYKFIDEEYGRKFAAEERVGKLAGFFALLAIFISCLGLFGLASYIAEQRTKEICVRKVLGASVFTVWRLLSREFIILVLLSCVIAIPLAAYFLRQWLSQFEYRVSLQLSIFAGAVLLSLLITILTVSLHAVRAAMINPVKALRTE